MGSSSFLSGPDSCEQSGGQSRRRPGALQVTASSQQRLDPEAELQISDQSVGSGARHGHEEQRRGDGVALEPTRGDPEHREVADRCREDQREEGQEAVARSGLGAPQVFGLQRVGERARPMTPSAASRAVATALRRPAPTAARCWRCRSSRAPPQPCRPPPASPSSNAPPSAAPRVESRRGWSAAARSARPG